MIYKLPVGQKISDIVACDKSLWPVDGIIRNDFPIMFGAPTINSVNICPALDRWKKLDPTGKYFKLYNRYAHIKIIFDSGATRFDIHLDTTTLLLNPADLPKLYEDAGSYIYRVN